MEPRLLLAYTIPDGFKFVESRPLDNTINTFQEFAADVVAGGDYLVVVSGQAKIGKRTDNKGIRYTDAVHYDAYTETGVFSKTFNTRIRLNGVSSAPGWGAYQADHMYGQIVTANASKIGVQFYDNPYNDNVNSPTVMTVKLYVMIKADLEIYKPAVIDSAQPMIPEADEATVGSATFVNLDNDDNDAHFDDTDDDVAGGDDELAKLTLKVKGTHPGSVIVLAGLAGGGDVKLWKQQDKATASAYALGSSIPLADFTKVGDWFTKDLWVEGTTAQTTAFGTMFKLTQTFNSFDSSDEAAIAVIGIEKVEWIGIDNAVDDSDNLGADPNWPGGLAPAAVRVFPDKRMFFNSGSFRMDAQPRSIVDVNVTLSVAPPFAVKTYLRAFDSDDPSADADDVDRELTNADNRGAPGTFGWQALGVTPSADVTKELSFAADEKAKKAQYIVSRQPGDNYRLVANADNDFLLRLNNNDDELNVGASPAEKNENKQRVVSQDLPVATVPADREVRQADKYCSDVLTVWRFLTVELDSMPALTPAQNSISGTASDITGSGTALTAIATVESLGDATPDTDDAPVGKGRFENGTLTLGRDATKKTITPVLDNGENSARFGAASIAGLSFDAADADFWTFTDHNTGTIIDVTKVGSSFVWTLNTTSEGDADWTEFVGGKLTVADGEQMEITAVNKTAGTMTTSSLRIPFSITDDDDLTTLPYPTSALSAVFMRAYQQAYIEPKLALTGNNTIATAQPNILPEELRALQESQMDVNRDDDFWVAYNLWVFQFHEGQDYDYNSESGAGLGSGRGWAVDSRYSGVAVESSRDSYVNGPSAASYAGWGYASFHDLVWRTTAHEVGHQFGLDHTNGGLMGAAEGPGADTLFFSPVDLALIRAKVTSPGR
jgi:hypothetical protein